MKLPSGAVERAANIIHLHHPGPLNPNDARGIARSALSEALPFVMQHILDTLDAQTITHTERGQQAVRQLARAWLKEYMEGKQQ